ncbi:MAG TPA: M48 family metallopeptidase [Bacillota bacterium]|nr:M48 family metallopeptidase [Bacillota bacterium]
MTLDVFQIPILIVPEERSTLHARFNGQTCTIKIPSALLNKKRQLILPVDHIYWRVLGQTTLPDLKQQTDRLNELHFGFSYHAVRFHRQFRRWGSCSTLRNINLSHRLIGAPTQLTDYIIIHELAHLKHLNHGKEFWGLVKSAGMNPVSARKEITLYGNEWWVKYQDWRRKLAKII